MCDAEIKAASDSKNEKSDWNWCWAMIKNNAQFRLFLAHTCNHSDQMLIHGLSQAWSPIMIIDHFARNATPQVFVYKKFVSQKNVCLSAWKCLFLCFSFSPYSKGPREVSLEKYSHDSCWILRVNGILLCDYLQSPSASSLSARIKLALLSKILRINDFTNKTFEWLRLVRSSSRTARRFAWCE